MTRADRLREGILLLRHRTGLTVPQFARRIGMTESTFKSRCRNPATFRLSELWALEILGEAHGVSLMGK